MLDNRNLEDGSIVFCRDYAAERGDDAGVRLAEDLLAMTRTQRKRVTYDL